MPVLVTGAESGLGLAVATAVAAGGGEVRAWLAEQPAPGSQEVGRGVETGSRSSGSRGAQAAQRLRRLGCKVARGGIDDEGRLELALEQVHTVMHCWGGPLQDAADELDAAAGVISAALGAGCRRIVWASHLGAATDAAHGYLRACAEVEELLAEATLESVVIRRSLTYGADDPFTRGLAATSADQLPTSRQAPLAVADLVAAFVEADVPRGGVGDLALRVELAGPEVTDLAGFGAELRRRVTDQASPLPGHTLSVYAGDHVPDAQTLGRSGTTIAQGLDTLAA